MIDRREFSALFAKVAVLLATVKMGFPLNPHSSSYDLTLTDVGQVDYLKDSIRVRLYRGELLVWEKVLPHTPVKIEEFTYTLRSSDLAEMPWMENADTVKLDFPELKRL